jgi:hypothetical protein
MNVLVDFFVNCVPSRRKVSLPGNGLDLVVFAIVLVYGGIYNINREVGKDDSTP